MMKRVSILVCCLVVLILCMHSPTGQNFSASAGQGGIAIEKLSGAGPMPIQGGPAGEQNTSGASMLLTMLWIFVVGMALNLSPCVYPLIPVTISYFGGKSIGGKDGETLSLSIVSVHALLYIAGLAVMNSMLGVIAALSGRLLGAVLQNPLTLIFVALILTAFAMSMFGFWEFRLPGAITGIAAKNYGGYFGSLFIGLTVGLIAAPCIGPFVVSLLMWVASKGNPWFGFLVFFTLSLGMGLPLFVLALLSGRIHRLPRSGEWMLWVRKLMGWILIGMAGYFLGPLLSETAGTVLLAAISIAAAIHLALIDSTKAGFGAFVWLKRTAGIAGIFMAVLLVWPMLTQGKGVQWQPYSEKVLAEAKNSGKPIIIDFSAEWCIPCREVEKRVFHNPAVIENAEKYFVTIRVDLTESGERAKENIARHYNVRGVPTIIFLEPGGEERKDLRVLELMPVEHFLARMEELRKTAQAR